ncbi:MAG: 5'/3'-nucleotidase SurE [Chloroflexota bacterium]
MMSSPRRHILLTNDDGIRSPGLWAAAEALSALGFVHVVAPREQWSGAGRSLPAHSDGLITPQDVQVNGTNWTVYAVGGTPAQAVQHGIYEISPVRPSLVVSGINYGENLSVGVTASGTVGAALEGATHGIPSLAVSLETDPIHYLTHSAEISFAVAAYFTVHFARLLLSGPLPSDVAALKVDVPSSATPDTPWALTRLSPNSYFLPIKPARLGWDDAKLMGYQVKDGFEDDPADSDSYAVRVARQVAVVPLSLDLTARTPREELGAWLGL